MIREDWPVPWADAFTLRMSLYPSVLGYWGVEGAHQVDSLGLYSPEMNWLTQYIRVQDDTPVHLRLLQMAAVHRAVSLHPHPDLPEAAVLDTPMPAPPRISAGPDPPP